MQSIDVRDLPEDVARAIETLVQSIRARSASGPVRPNSESTAGEILAPLIEEAKSLPRSPSKPALHGDEAEVEQTVVDKYRKTGAEAVT